MNANANANDSNINLTEVGINLFELAERLGRYFIENITAITTVVIVIISVMVYQQIMYVQHGIDITGSGRNGKNSQTVIVEPFESADANADGKANLDSLLEAGFCKTHLGKPAELETACGKMSKHSCTATSCCVWASMDSKESCVSGNQHGPIFKTHKNGAPKTLDYYYFENKCSGNCPKSE
jgi:hypothetical protein